MPGGRYAVVRSKDASDEQPICPARHLHRPPSAPARFLACFSLLSPCYICARVLSLLDSQKWVVRSSGDCLTLQRTTDTVGRAPCRMVSVPLRRALGGRSDVYVGVLCEFLSSVRVLEIAHGLCGCGCIQIIMFSDLETDYINPIDFCNKMNKVRAFPLS